MRREGSHLPLAVHGEDFREHLFDRTERFCILNSARSTRCRSRHFHEGRAVPGFDDIANLSRVLSTREAGQANNDRRPPLDLTKIDPPDIVVEDLCVGTIWKGGKNL